MGEVLTTYRNDIANEMHMLVQIRKYLPLLNFLKSEQMEGE